MEEVRTVSDFQVIWGEFNLNSYDMLLITAQGAGDGRCFKTIYFHLGD